MTKKAAARLAASLIWGHGPRMGLLAFLVLLWPFSYAFVRKDLLIFAFLLKVDCG